MGMLHKFQNEAKMKLAQDFQNLIGSIQDDFAGTPERYNTAESFGYSHNGLTNVYIKMNLTTSLFKLTVHGHSGLGSVELDSLRMSETNGIRHGDINEAKFAKKVSKNACLKQNWKIKPLAYGHASFTIETNKLNDEILRELVLIMENVGFIPNAGMQRNVFS